MVSAPFDRAGLAFVTPWIMGKSVCSDAAVFSCRFVALPAFVDRAVLARSVLAEPEYWSSVGPQEGLRLLLRGFLLDTSWAGGPKRFQKDLVCRCSLLTVFAKCPSSDAGCGLRGSSVPSQGAVARGGAAPGRPRDADSGSTVRDELPALLRPGRLWQVCQPDALCALAAALFRVLSPLSHDGRRADWMGRWRGFVSVSLFCVCLDLMVL